MDKAQLKTIDAQIAEKVFGAAWRRPTHGTCCTCQTCGWPNDWECKCGYSSDIEKAWEIVEKLPHFTLRRKNNTWTVDYRDCQNPMDHMVINECCASASADTAPLAICLAALEVYKNK